MKEIKLVSAKEMVTLEDYLVSLFTAVASLKTIGTYQMLAIDKGILADDEIKVSGYITDSIVAIMRLYMAQVENVRERVLTPEDEIIAQINKIMPDMKIPPKRKNTRKKKDEVPNIS